MKLDIPFIKSRGFECGQACTAMVIKYFRSEFEPDFDEMNWVIKHVQGKYGFPPQLAILLDHYGIKAKCFSDDVINASTEDPGQFQRWYGKDYEQQMKFVDVVSFDWMVETMRQKQLLEKRKTEFEEMIEWFKQGKVVYFPIDWNTLNNKGGSYVGHFVVLTGIEGDDVLIHDPDVGPYIKYSFQQVKKAWEHPVIADDLIIVEGLKQQEVIQ
ncbi:MAG: papain-like cysteine protease family protein [Patescibacteria group bacterium]|nr:papain-like cysteine protease family protein [Patescibacteria group bacterium]